MGLPRLFAAVALVSGFGFGVGLGAQPYTRPRPVPAKVLAGPDIGFRVEGTDGDAVIGKIVVKIDGRWVEARLGDVGGGLPAR